MTCDESIERLPWLLNGTLEAGEHDEIRRHLATCERCRAALNDTREAWEIFDQHLPSQALVALAYGETPEGNDPDLAERHLASCPRCAAELELARMSRRLEEEDNITPFPVARPRSSAPSRGWRNAAAAAGLTTLVASAGWIYQIQQTTVYSAQVGRAQTLPAATAPREDSGALQKKFGELAATVSQLQSRQEETEMRARKAEAQVAEFKAQNGAPHASTLVILDTPAVVRAGGEQNAPAPTEVRQSPLPAAVLLQAAKNGQEPGSRKAEIVDGAGTKLRLPEVLPFDAASGYYTLSVPAGFLKRGPYTIRLLDPKSGELRETYAITVR
jgi:hypothetical protein